MVLQFLLARDFGILDSQTLVSISNNLPNPMKTPKLLESTKKEKRTHIIKPQTTNPIPIKARRIRRPIRRRIIQRRLKRRRSIKHPIPNTRILARETRHRRLQRRIILRDGGFLAGLDGRALGDYVGGLVDGRDG